MFTGSLVRLRLRADGAHGLGTRRPTERLPGRHVPHARFCRRHGGAHHFRSLRAGLCTLPGQTHRIPVAIHAAPQRRAELHRRLPAVGGLVRIQRWKRTERWPPGHQRVRRHPLRRRCRGGRLGGRRMDPQRQAERPGRDIRSRSRTGGHYAGIRIRQPHGRAGHRRDCGCGLLPDGHRGQDSLQLTTTPSTPLVSTAPAEHWARSLRESSRFPP